MQITKIKYIKQYITIIPIIMTALLNNNLATANSLTPLSDKDCELMKTNNVITAENPVPCARLMRVTFDYLNFNKVKATGDIVVLDILAKHVDNIFTSIMKRGFLIKQSILMEHYKGDDNASMADDNTSAFNGRSVTGKTGVWSHHAYGAAIDINPIENPYISFQDGGTAQILPPAASTGFINRNNTRLDKQPRIGMAESVIDVFARNGFMDWGGYWDSPIDYQHFEIGNTAIIKELIEMPLPNAQAKFDLYVQTYRNCMTTAATITGMQKKHAQKRNLCIAKARLVFSS